MMIKKSHINKYIVCAFIIFHIIEMIDTASLLEPFVTFTDKVTPEDLKATAISGTLLVVILCTFYIIISVIMFYGTYKMKNKNFTSLTLWISFIILVAAYYFSNISQFYGLMIWITMSMIALQQMIDTIIAKKIK